jgi:hypothetical protein
LDKSDPPKIVYHDASLKPVRQISPRQSSTSTSNIYTALKKKQELFQVRQFEILLLILLYFIILQLNAGIMFIILISHNYCITSLMSHGWLWMHKCTAFLYSCLCMFQRNDGLPVHFKGGPVDKVLFGITMALCVVGTALSLQTLYVLSYPKKA